MICKILLLFLYAFPVLGTKTVIKAPHIHEAHVHEKHVHEKVEHHVPIVETHDAVTHTCPPNYWMEGGVCISKSAVDLIQICPHGSTQVGDECFVYSAVRYACPDGGELIDMECVIHSDKPKEVVCPPGTVLQGDQCVIALDIPASCPDGTALIGHKCIQASPIQKTCPPGFAPHGSVCARYDTAEPIPICPTQMVMQGNMCVLTVPIQPVCPPGAVDEGDKCVVFKPKVSHCPPGYTASVGACIKSLTAVREVACDNGADPHDGCRVVINVALSPSCPRGTEPLDGECIRRVTKPALLRCPPDYTLQGATCVKIVSYDCSTTTYEVKCEDTIVVEHEKHDHIHDKGHDHGKHRQLTAEKVKHAPHVHEKHEHHHPAPLLPVCQKFPITTSQMCEKAVEADATPYCEDGSLRGMNLCELIVKEPMSTKCGGKTDAMGNCFIEETSPPLYFCPPGYMETSGSVCTKIEAVDLIENCPPETMGPKCAVFTGKSCPSGVCERIISEPPFVLCPEGYAKTATAYAKDVAYKGKSKKGYSSHKVYEKDVCKKTIFADLKPSCPLGLEPMDEATCVSFVEMVPEYKTQTVAPEFRCPVGYAHSTKGHTCTAMVHNAAVPICAHDAFIDNHRCARQTPRVKDCPHGATADAGGCWILHTAEPILVDTVIEGLRKHNHYTHTVHAGHSGHH